MQMKTTNNHEILQISRIKVESGLANLTITVMTFLYSMYIYFFGFIKCKHMWHR